MQTDLQSQFQSLQWQLEEHLPVGSPVEVIIGLPRELTAEELASLGQGLKKERLELLTMPQIGNTQEWANALKLKFRRPVRYLGELRSTQLAALLSSSLLRIGVGDILGWQLRGG